MVSFFRRVFASQLVFFVLFSSTGERKTGSVEQGSSASISPSISSRDIEDKRRSMPSHVDERMRSTPVVMTNDDVERLRDTFDTVSGR